MGTFAFNLTADKTGLNTPWNGTLVKDDFRSSVPESWDNIFGVLLTFIIITGLTLNVIVILTLLRNRNRKQVSMDYFILALATSDFLVVMTCYPMNLASIIARRWLFGSAGCVVNGFLGFIFSLTDIGILTTMSVVRLIMVKMPYCVMIKSKSCTLVLIVAVCGYSLIWTLSPVLGWGRYAPEPYGTSCTINWKFPDKSYVTCIFIAVLVIPSSIMLVSYCSIVNHMRRTAGRVDRYFTERRRQAKRQKRLIKMTVVMCACFILTWTPYAVVSICSAYIPDFEINPVQSAIPTVLAKASHVFNPIIYFSTNSNYKARLKMFWHRKFNSSRGTETRTGRPTVMTDPAENSMRSLSFTSQVVGRDTTSAPCIHLTTCSGSKYLIIDDEDQSNTLLGNNKYSPNLLSASDTGDVFI